MDMEKLALELDPQQIREMLTHLGIIDMKGVGKLLGVEYHRVKMLRREAGKTRPDQLPAALPIPGNPLYLEREIIIWAKQAGHLDLQGKQIRKKPTGNNIGRVLDKEHWSQVAYVKKWADEISYPGGAAKAIADLWGVDRNATVYRWLKRVRDAE